MLNKSTGSMQPRQSNHPRGGGGVTTDDPMPGDSLSLHGALKYYTYETIAGKNAGNKKFKPPGSQNSFKLPLHDFYRDPYDACMITPANCVNDMSGYTIPLDSIRKSDTLSYAKTGVSPIPNYYDVKYKDDIIDPDGDDYTISEDELKGCAAQRDFCETDSSALNYIVYSPINVDYSNCKLPGIILFHAGGYSDCSNYKYEDSLCYALARKGFIIYLVEYRRGRIKDINDKGIYTSAQQMLALYRAMQDGRGAIRSIIKRQRNIASNHLPYQVDTNNIFVAGQSAGAGIANSLAYYRNQTMINQMFPVPPGEMPIEDALGPIDADFYFGSPDIEYQSKIKGLWSMWGGFGIPVDSSDAGTEYNFLSHNGDWTLVPMIGFMGKNDQVFPIQKKKQYVYYPPIGSLHVNFIKETSCILSDSFKVYNYSIPLVPDFRIECTNDIYNIFKTHGIPTLEYIDCSMGHGLYHTCGTCICPTDFGAPGHVLTTNQVNEYLASRACFFFQSIMNNLAGSLTGTSRFINCPDFRHSKDSCATAPDNGNCTDDQACTADD
ncbi:MAG: alpha/beta hydrolase [Chitinophagaceae bacterium]